MATVLISKGNADSVIIRLNMEEASAVKRVFGKVNGSRAHTRRKHIADIWEALDRLDISPGEWLDTEGTIAFLPIPEPKTRKVS